MSDFVVVRSDSPRCKHNDILKGDKMRVLNRLNARMKGQISQIESNIILRMSGEKRTRDWEEYRQPQVVVADDRRPRLPAADKWIDNIDIENQDPQSPIRVKILSAKGQEPAIFVTPDFNFAGNNNARESVSENKNKCDYDLERRPKLPVMNEYPELKGTRQLECFQNAVNEGMRVSEAMEKLDFSNISPTKAKIRAFWMKNRVKKTAVTEKLADKQDPSTPVQAAKIQKNQEEPSSSSSVAIVQELSPTRVKEITPCESPGLPIGNGSNRKKRITQLLPLLDSVFEVSLECSANAIAALEEIRSRKVNTE